MQPDSFPVAVSPAPVSDAGHREKLVPSRRRCSRIAPVTLFAEGADTQPCGCVRGRVSADSVSGDTGSPIGGGQAGLQAGWRASALRRRQRGGILLTDPMCFRVGQMVLNYLYLAQVHIRRNRPLTPLSTHTRSLWREGLRPQGRGWDGAIPCHRPRGRGGRRWSLLTTQSSSWELVLLTDRGGRPAQLSPTGFMGHGPSGSFFFKLIYF